MQIGYTFTASLEDCKNHLLKVGGREISAQDVVKVISSMYVKHASLGRWVQVGETHLEA
ncbi:CCR4-NOT transcription complex subunit 1 [Culex quinquefasciatus]|uniref:CCR4-NOT transcription complex subunit 1 n=1 Tax=Culex quinquefasciatus TaxID=7176 RepID=UPI0018E3A52C|nr:CCR4-NOT transcription complex subunit 1 [Culex quinquefasciatus]